MDLDSSKGPLLCPECWAKNAATATACWMCGGPLQPGVAKPELLPELAPRPSSSTFRLSSLMVVIALVAVFLGVGREEPGLAILLAIVAGPGLLFTFGKSLRRGAEGVPMTAAEQAGAFLAAVAVTVAVIASVIVVAVVSVVVALYVICLGTCN